MQIQKACFVQRVSHTRESRAEANFKVLVIIAKSGSLRLRELVFLHPPFIGQLQAYRYYNASGSAFYMAVRCRGWAGTLGLAVSPTLGTVPCTIHQQLYQTLSRSITTARS